MGGIQTVFLLTIAGAAGFFDLREGRIPNRLIMTGLLCGFLFQCYYWGWIGFLIYCSGVLAPAILLGVLFYFRMIGAGDIKLLCVIGGFLGPHCGIECIFYSFLIGGIYSIVLMFKRHSFLCRLVYFKTYVSQLISTKQWQPYICKEDKDSQIHFAIPIFGSVLLYVCGVY